MAAAARVAGRAGIRADWLNDGLKGFLSEHGSFTPFLELDHPRVMVAQPEHLLAMKCLALRLERFPQKTLYALGELLQRRE
ncbi:MAG: hypothetical protein JNK40_05220 [Chromatiales bacterium]|nr:hypothetical protein [Chromatiales bacterium]